MTSDRYFRESPFALTASRETAACWSGRIETQERLNRLQASFDHRTDSSLDVVWANFGAGKSHVLYHLQHRLNSAAKADKKTIVAFVEMPEQLRKFMDLYTRIVRALPLDQIAQLVASAEPRQVSDDLRRCATALLNGGPAEKDLAEQWISGGHPGLRELKSSVGIRTRIDDDIGACDTLSGIVAASSNAGVRIVVLLDEFQRVATAQPASKRDAILSNIRSVFSRNPRGFSMVVAVTSRMEQTALSMFPKELRSLLGARPAVSLPVLSRDEAIEFLLGRFKFFRPPGFNSPDAAPFGKSAIEAIVDKLSDGDGSRLIPRQLLEAMAWVYDSACDDGHAEISAAKATKALEDLRWDTVE